jgi:uncharacterized protein (DUF433 family)
VKQQLVREMVGGEWYEYIPLGKFIVSAPEVCRGRPTFKYTRIEVAGVLERLVAGHDIEALIIDSRGRLSCEAIAEAAILAAKALTQQATCRAGRRPMILGQETRACRVPRPVSVEIYPLLGHRPIAHDDLATIQQLREGDIRTLHRFQLGAQRVLL